MCQTHVYQCPSCSQCMSIPEVKPGTWRSWWWNLAGCWNGGCPEPLEDKLCDNRYCMRRTWGGYQACLAMDDPCYFCIRYGFEKWCFNRYVPLQCRTCFKGRSPQTTDPWPPQPHLSQPPHHRRLIPLKDLEDSAVSEAVFDLKLYRQGRLSLTEAALLANTAVLAATHK